MTSRQAAAGLAALFSLGCVSTAPVARDWSDYDGPGARYFHAEEVTFPFVLDELEPVNRVSAGVTHQLSRWVLAPIAAGYRWVVPGSIRRGLGRVGENFLFPRRVINNVLQWKLEGAGVETLRFGLNTTVGVAGFFDPAEHWGLRPHPEDFGQTFAAWGWDESTYLFLPVLGPSSVRDGIGRIPDALTDPATYFFPASWFRGFNSLSSHIHDDLRAVVAKYDAYEPARTLATLRRTVSVNDFRWKSDESGATQTLEAVFLEPEDEGFAGRRRDGEVVLAHTGRALPYSSWLQPHAAPILYLVPGTAGHRLDPSTLAVAELAYDSGLSVAAVSSPANWEFMRFAGSTPVPGVAPVDVADLRSALTAIDTDLETRHPARLLGRRVGGLSLGAFEALVMAATEDRAAGTDELIFELYLAINPPVEMEHALLRLDECYNAPLAFPEDERQRRIDEIYGKVIHLANGDIEPGIELPFLEHEAEFLIGLAFRLDLQFLLMQSRDLEDTGVLRTPRTALHRAPAFREASEYSFMEYFYAFVLPYHARHDPGITFDEAGARTLFERCSLIPHTAALERNERVRVFSNVNDFLLTTEHVAWLRSTFGERATLLEEGGHLGNLHRDDIQRVLEELMRGELEPR